MLEIEKIKKHEINLIFSILDVRELSTRGCYKIFCNVLFSTHILLKPAFVPVMNVESAIQGETIGIIVPPPDIKAIVNKTAQFVARNGKSFEERILASDEGK